MSHYIDDDGPFAHACEALAETGWALDWRAIATPGASKKPAKNTKVKFTCPECGANAWGKKTLNIHCADCDVPMVNAE
jgi:predicted deacylase